MPSEPIPLKDNEEVLRLGWRRREDGAKRLAHEFPCDFDEEGRMYPEAISMEDLRQRGFSVQRTEFFGYKDAAEEATRRHDSSNGDILCVGFVLAGYAQIAAISHEGAPAFSVCPDGHLDDRHDAHVSITFVSKCAKQAEKKLRMLLRQTFSTAKTLGSLESRG